jgi:hypothetical protein
MNAMAVRTTPLNHRQLGPNGVQKARVTPAIKSVHATVTATGE